MRNTTSQHALGKDKPLQNPLSRKISLQANAGLVSGSASEQHALAQEKESRLKREAAKREKLKEGAPMQKRTTRVNKIIGRREKIHSTASITE